MVLTDVKAIKQELYRRCQDYLRERVRTAREAIADAQQAANDETKSSSGDKYETGRAMMQLEVEKNSVQLAESLRLQQALDQIDIKTQSDVVCPGSLVITDRGVYYIAISLGKVILQGETYFVIAATSPIGGQLMGLKAGDTMTFRGTAYVVREVR